MRLVRYNPFNELTLFRNTFNDLFADTAACVRDTREWAPAVDILDREDHVELAVELPGVKKEDIKVNIEDRILTISGEHASETEDKQDSYYRRERRYGSFRRAFTLSDDILADEVTADYRDGILKIVLKKDSVKEAVKQITVN